MHLGTLRATSGTREQIEGPRDATSPGRRGSDPLVNLEALGPEDLENLDGYQFENLVS